MSGEYSRIDVLYSTTLSLARKLWLSDAVATVADTWHHDDGESPRGSDRAAYKQ